MPLLSLRSLSCLAACGLVAAFSASASAGMIADENARAGFGRWAITSDGTANGAGVCDVYPADWSIVPGQTLRLKVRSTTSYSVRILRLGYYGGRDSRQVSLRTGLPSDPQPYPTSDSKYGMAEARWHDSVTFSTSGWVPGMYVARVERGDGRQAEAIFVVRDDNGPRMPILMLLSTTTHAAYNAWPHAKRGGKSLYGFNSSSAHPSESISGINQAVKVSFDRPYLVGGGTADLGNYEYPMARFLEKEGWDVAYANDEDLHNNPSILDGRRAVIIVGHSEYWSRNMFNAVLAARDRGVNFFISSGDTLSWQVRFESGPAGSTSTVVGYKESWVKDPEQKLAYSLKNQGRIEEAKAHYKLVTRGWKRLEYDPGKGIDERRPGIIFTGVMSSGIIRNADGSIKGAYPWADLSVTNSTHWLFKGTGMSYGSRIHGVMGYEVDSSMSSSSEYDKWRPANQFRLGAIKQVSDGKIKGGAAYYYKNLSSGGRAEIVAMGAIAFSWALDDWASPGTTVDSRAQTMMNNALRRWTGTPIYDWSDVGQDQDPDPSAPDQPNEVEPNIDPATYVDETPSNPTPNEESSAEGNGLACNAGGQGSSNGAVLGITLGALGLAVVLRRRRR